MPRLALALTAVVLAVLIALPCAALATTPGHWDPVTSADGQNIDQVATLRTPDGQVHVIWHRKTPGNSANGDLMQTVIAPNGTAGAPRTLATNGPASAIPRSCGPPTASCWCSPPLSGRPTPSTQS